MRRKNNPSTGHLIPAAEYVRMSTDDQLYSIAIQQAGIREYAANHGYSIVATYADEGRSGVALKTRKALERLLKDVLSERARFKVILVYDVSRWGRFQDSDEAAHYEYLCKWKGIPVHYCAEQFRNDTTMPSAIMKALKRSMAAEFSRELGVKVLAGAVKRAKMGHRVAGDAGLGLRRMMVSPDGRKKLLLQSGERKAIHSYHSTLVPGPQKEVEAIREIFRLATEKRRNGRRIARYLNQKKLWPWPDEERRWSSATVYGILRNEKYVGTSVYGKTTQKLGQSSKRTSPEKWIVVPNAFEALVEPSVFEKVRAVMQSRRRSSKSDDYYLDGLRRVLARHGKITQRLSTGRGICAHDTYTERFGSIMNAYKLVGYKPSAQAFASVANQHKVKKLLADFLTELKEMYPENLRMVHLPGQRQRHVLEFDGHVRIALHICRQIKGTVAGEPRWALKAQPLEEGYPCLICLTNMTLTKLLSIHLVPQFGGIIGRVKSLHKAHKWLIAGREVTDLTKLRVMATAMAGELQERDDTIAVGDVVISFRTSTVRIGREDISLSPIKGELFKLLVLKAGKVVSRKKLSHPFTAKEFPSAHLNAHMCDLRRKLGPRISKRIQTVKNQGYRYVMPTEPETEDSIPHSSLAA